MRRRRSKYNTPPLTVPLALDVIRHMRPQPGMLMRSDVRAATPTSRLTATRHAQHAISHTKANRKQRQRCARIVMTHKRKRRRNTATGRALQPTQPRNRRCTQRRHPTLRRAPPTRARVLTVRGTATV